MALTHRDFAAAALSASLLAAPGAFAEDDMQLAYIDKQPKTSTPMLSVGDRATEYAKNNGAVGIVLSYGSHPSLPPAAAIGNRIVEEYKNVHAANSDYFVVPNDTPGVAIYYHVGEVAIGPFGDFESALEGTNKAALLLRGPEELGQQHNVSGTDYIAYDAGPGGQD